MKWIIRLLRDQFMSLCTHKDIRRFDADHQIVISQVFDDMNFIQRTLHQSLCSDSMIFLHKFFLKRTAVYTNTNRYPSLLCHINHCFDALCTADISGIDPNLICTVFHGCNGKTIIKMDICHKWYMNLFFDFLQCFCSFHSRYCATDNITACLLQCQDLSYCLFYIFSFCICHGLDQNRVAATDLSVSDLNDFCMISVHNFPLLSFIAIP